MKYIKGYDGLRAVSILLVVLTHLDIYSALPNNQFVQLRVWPLFSGVLGVQIFFALSGFLITRILLQERDKDNTINLRNFYARRFIRLLPPLIIFYIAIALLMYYKMIVTTSIGFIMAVLYIYNFVPQKFYTGELGHMWSLSLEEQFYILWPVLLLFISNSRQLLMFIGAMVVLCAVSIFILPNIPVTFNGTDTILGKAFLVKRWFVPAVAPILIGSALAIMANTPSSSFQRICTNRFLPLWATLLFVSPLYMPLQLNDVNFILQTTGISLFLVWIYHNQQHPVTNALEFKPLSYIGKISYGIYVYQGFFLRTGPSEGLAVQQFPLNIILVVVTAVLSYEFFEKKVLKLKKKFR